MTTYTTQTTTYIWRTLLFNGLALALCQTAFLLAFYTPLAWFIAWLYPAGPLLIALVAFTFTTKRLPLPPHYALLVLPVVLYASQIAASLIIWQFYGGHANWNPVSFEAEAAIKIFGLYGISAGLLWVFGLLRTWKYARAAHRTQTGVPD